MAGYVSLEFECSSCPPLCGIFSLHATEAERDALTPGNIPYRCPRGHALTWTAYRCYLPLDDAGYVLPVGVPCD